MALLAAVPAFADPSVSSKRAEAIQVEGQLQQLSDSLEKARSQYDAATNQLARIQRDIHENRLELQAAKHNLVIGERTIEKRLVDLYTSDQASTLEVILGAKNLDDLLTRLDNAKQVTAQDATVLLQVKHFKTAVTRTGSQLASERAAQNRLVVQRAAAKASIESKISQEQRLYSSIQGEIEKILAQQHARQLQLAADARARLQRDAAQRQAEANGTIVGISAATPEADTVVAPPPTHGDVVSYAMSQLNVPYSWGAASPGVAFDCSGLVMWAYSQVGVSLPHSSYAMWNYGVSVSRDELAPGDIVFFDGLGHVGLYIGGGQFVEAPHTGDVVKISSLDEGWYASTYVGARRIL